MEHRAVPLGLAAVAAVALAVATAGPATASSPTTTPFAPAAVTATGLVADFGCAHPSGAHTLGCFGKIKSQRASNGRIAPQVTGSPTGLNPADLASAYNLAGTSGGGRTVAIVDAYDDPKAEADLAVYRAKFNLPACTTANGCFKKVNQNGSTTGLPTADAGWALEISLDLDMVSATCPSCKILLVEASTPSDDALMAGVDTAVRLGAVAVSNSYGGAEDSTQLAADAHLNHPGVAITASSGDSGYGASWPAASPYVTAVGGTKLTKTTGGRGWTEVAWTGAGSGCSAYEPKPSWQHDTGCAKRTIADVSAVADPASGVSVYDTYNTCGSSSLCDFLISIGLVQGADGWVTVGGTSASSPIIASVYALAGNSVTAGSYPYAHTGSLYDITSGSNGSCGGTYLCTAGAGYDGPTGLGTPHGTGGF